MSGLKRIASPEWVVLNEDILRLRDLGRGIVVAKLDYKCAEVKFDLVTVGFFNTTISD